jgi:SMODS-associated and fused to various effectors sensor domain
VARNYGQIFSDELIMTDANVARHQGDDFQARMFWLKATALLDPKSNVVRVSYESGPKSFDDITIEYDPARPERDQEGKPIYRRHLQCKWHRKAGVYGHADFINPKFINADTVSLLQKVHRAQQLYAADGVGARFQFHSNWRLDASDPVLSIIRKDDGVLDIIKFSTGTDRSEIGKVRKLWRDHLGIDDAALALAARTFAIIEEMDTLESLRERLDDRLSCRGLRRIPSDETGFLYDDVIKKLQAQRRTEFDRKGFAEMCEQERLFDRDNPQQDMIVLGIRSFLHSIDSLDERGLELIDLVPQFDGRYIKNDGDWQNVVLPKIKAGAINAARSADYIRLIIDSHASIAFAVGTVLNVKCGKKIEIEQRSGGKRIWSSEDGPARADWPGFTITEERVDNRSGDEIALAIGLTRDVREGTRAFVNSHLPRVGRIVDCRPSDGSSQLAVQSGRHAVWLAEQIVQHVRTVADSGRPFSRAHLFISAPNAFTFFLGQHQQALGPVQLYEWDFEGQRSRGYSPAVGLGYSI